MTFSRVSAKLPALKDDADTLHRISSEGYKIVFFVTVDDNFGII